MSITTFKRYELKFSLTEEEYKVITQELKKHMEYDDFCKNENYYMIYNIYFDTENNEVIRNSLSKPYFKEKLRLRSYKIPTSGNQLVFLELKRKIGGIVAKRRLTLTYNEAMDFVINGIRPSVTTYQEKCVLNEINNFLSLYPSKPAVYISYERVAFFDKNNKNFRISFDKNILTRRDNVNLENGDYGSNLLGENKYLMEVKCTGSTPMWLVSMLSEMKVYKTSFSKYGAEYKNYLALYKNVA